MEKNRNIKKINVYVCNSLKKIFIIENKDFLKPVCFDEFHFFDIKSFIWIMKYFPPNVF